jgi:hypothetical protein
MRCDFSGHLYGADELIAHLIKISDSPAETAAMLVSDPEHAEKVNLLEGSLDYTKIYLTWVFHSSLMALEILSKVFCFRIARSYFGGHYSCRYGSKLLSETTCFHFRTSYCG